MKLLCMSDIHGRFGSFPPAGLPEADLCLIAGDITNWGKRNDREWRASLDWVTGLSARYPAVAYILGNHDMDVGGQEYELSHNVYEMSDTKRLLPHPFVGSHLSFVGVNLTTAYDMPELVSTWRNMTTRPGVEAVAYDLPTCDVLVSHGPPYGVLDTAGVVMVAPGEWEARPIGARELTDYIERHAPKLVVCGHVHLNGLLGKAQWERVGETLVVNVAETAALVDTDTWEVVR